LSVLAESADIAREDSLDGLAELVTHLVPCMAALLLEATPLGDRVVGQHGLTTAQANTLLVQFDACAPGLPDIDIANSPWRSDTAMAIAVGGRETVLVRRLPLPAEGGHRGGWLILMLTPHEQGDVNDASRLQALAHHAGVLLRRLAQHAALHPLDSHLSDGHSTTADNSESESRLNLTERTAGVGSWSIDLVSQSTHHSEGCARILGLQERHTEWDLEFMIATPRSGATRCASAWNAAPRWARVSTRKSRWCCRRAD
jgi:hypothetical protein